VQDSLDEREGKEGDYLEGGMEKQIHGEIPQICWF
jgi:hypothetical protein